MTNIDSDTTRKIIISLADKILGETGSREEAMEFAISTHCKEVQEFADFVKATQLAGKDAMAMTPDTINAYNEMMWGCALMMAIVGGGSKMVPDDEREAVN